MDFEHQKKLSGLQQNLKNLKKKNGQAFAIRRAEGHSNTTHAKTYKDKCNSLNFKELNKIVHVDTNNNLAFAEPYVTMEKLVDATLQHGLIPKVVPEFKGITIGGAIMGEAAESSSHLWGTFHDTCQEIELLCGNGDAVTISEANHPDLFYGIAGSYGSLGALTLASIQLIEAKKGVHLRYDRYRSVQEAIKALRAKIDKKPMFLDGLVLSKDSIVLIEGSLSDAEPTFTMNPKSEWYIQHVKKIAPDTYEEVIPVRDYLFRYDNGAFWMGAYLYKPRLLAKLFLEGITHILTSNPDGFTQAAINKFYPHRYPNMFKRRMSGNLMKSQSLWGILHKAEKWVQDRFVIQDFCIPENNAEFFLAEILDRPAIFPIWLCPIKGTTQPQIFSPHLLIDNSCSHFINIGLYGLAKTVAPISEILGRLENKTYDHGGRKVLYSRSYYTLEKFWAIYSFKEYSALREKYKAKGTWKDITEKVLSD